MKIPYCICEKRSKEVFSNGFIIFGLVVYPLLVVFVFFGGGPILLLLTVFLCIQGAWAKLEFKRQALFLGHNFKCASRYSTLAAVAAFRGYNPEYGKLTGYRSAIRTKVEQLLGKRRTKHVYRAVAIAGGLVLISLIILSTYNG